MKGLIKQLLLNENYLILNKTIIHNLGIEGAIILSALAEADKLLADENGWFYQTADTLEEHTTLSRYKQDVALKKLRDLGILKQKNMGIPMTRHFKLEYEVLANYFVSHSQTRIQRNDKLDLKEFETNKEINNKESNDKEINIKNYTKKEIDFDSFWSAYPKKVSKGQALKTFNKVVKDEETLDLILADLDKRKRFKQWTENQGQFIPYPSSYLNNQGWLDEYEVEKEFVRMFAIIGEE